MNSNMSIVGLTVDVLDKGFVRVVDVMGNDAAVVQAARVSYGDGTKSVREDRGLIRYLMRHWHTSPFEMCEVKLHIKAPIFVARQWLRHRTASVNEYSARYSVVRNEFYEPSPELIAGQSPENMQGRGVPLGAAKSAKVAKLINDHASRSYELYDDLLHGESPVARELARVMLPLNAYTEFYWKIDLHNLMHFIRLRVDQHAQVEIRAYADTLLSIIRRWVPHCCEAFLDYRLHGEQFSHQEMALLRSLLRGGTLNAKAFGLTDREGREFAAKLGLEGGDSKSDQPSTEVYALQAAE